MINVIFGIACCMSSTSMQMPLMPITIYVMHTVLKPSVPANVKDGLNNLDHVILASKISQGQVPKKC